MTEYIVPFWGVCKIHELRKMSPNSINFEYKKWDIEFKSTCDSSYFEASSFYFWYFCLVILMFHANKFKIYKKENHKVVFLIRTKIVHNSNWSSQNVSQTHSYLQICIEIAFVHKTMRKKGNFDDAISRKQLVQSQKYCHPASQTLNKNSFPKCLNSFFEILEKKIDFEEGVEESWHGQQSFLSHKGLQVCHWGWCDISNSYWDIARKPLFSVRLTYWSGKTFQSITKSK